MRTLFALLGIVVISGLSLGASSQDGAAALAKVCVLDVANMACSSCAAAVEKAALKIAGVRAAKVSQPTNSAEITFDPNKTTPQAIAKAITKKTGFPAKPRADSK